MSSVNNKLYLLFYTECDTMGSRVDGGHPVDLLGLARDLHLLSPCVAQPSHAVITYDVLTSSIHGIYCNRDI